MKVLVVDDSALVRQRLVEMISTLAGVEQVETAASASDARRAIEVRVPDLVVLDIHMPGRSGLDVLDAVPADDPVTTIVLTNDATPQWRRACLQAGADFFFDKSAEFQHAADLIERLVAATPPAAGEHGDRPSLSGRGDT